MGSFPEYFFSVLDLGLVYRDRESKRLKATQNQSKQLKEKAKNKPPKKKSVFLSFSIF